MRFMNSFSIASALLLTATAALSEPELLPTIEGNIQPADWLCAGPFSVGVREGIAGVIEDAKNFRPYEGLEHRSILPQGGSVKWERSSIDSLGWLNIEYQDVYWDSLMVVWGIAGLADVGYAYAEFESEGRRRALVRTQEPGSFILNGKSYYGNPYGDGYMVTPVVLEDGLNTVLVGLSGFGDHRLRFELLPAPDPLVLVVDDATVPDMVEGEMLDGWAGITVLNTTERRLTDVEISVGDDRLFAMRSVRDVSVEPLSIRKLPIPLQQMEEYNDTGSARVPASASWGSLTYEDSLSLRVRKADESRVRTFISRIDSSCQYYAVLPPLEYDPGSKYALILTLHGAGVEARGQVDSYKPKEWAFVVAPTNRRRFGFDWQDWGRLDALEVLDLAKRTLPIDTNRVYLVGHSMGGHGTWHVGLAHADLFAAMAPAAGWTCFQLYVPWFLQKAYIFGEPKLIAMRDMSLREDCAPDFVRNALNLPVFILHGGVDDNVPTVHGRFFAGLLENFGYEYIYKEVPGKRHWWSEDGLVCVDDPDLLEFLKSHQRNPHPRRVFFKTNNIAQSSRSFWVEIDRQELPYFESSIEAEVKDNSIDISTANILEFTVSLSRELLPYGQVSIAIDGKKLSHEFVRDDKLSFYKKKGQFVKGRPRRAGLEKRPDLYGPMKQAYFSPFVIVYGTRGDSAITESLHYQARSEGFRWWHRANGSAEVLADSEVTGETISECNLILFGGEGENLVTAKIENKLPIRAGKKEIHVGERIVRGDGLAAEFVYPNPLNPEKLVFIHEGADSTGLAISASFGTIYSGAGLPDYMIFDQSVKNLGWAGVICAGFFGNDWDIDERLMYIKP
jgi:pimeloyl-ACP methyl ester carboxylesterase